jgi:hypothetical protein
MGFVNSQFEYSLVGQLLQSFVEIKFSVLGHAEHSYGTVHTFRCCSSEDAGFWGSFTSLLVLNR